MTPLKAGSPPDQGIVASALTVSRGSIALRRFDSSFSEEKEAKRLYLLWGGIPSENYCTKIAARRWTVADREVFVLFCKKEPKNFYLFLSGTTSRQSPAKKQIKVFLLLFLQKKKKESPEGRSNPVCSRKTTKPRTKRIA